MAASVASGVLGKRKARISAVDFHESIWPPALFFCACTLCADEDMLTWNVVDHIWVNFWVDGILAFRPANTFTIILKFFVGDLRVQAAPAVKSRHS